MVARGIHYNAAIYDTPTVCISSWNPPLSSPQYAILGSYLYCVCAGLSSPTCELPEAIESGVVPVHPQTLADRLALIWAWDTFYERTNMPYKCTNKNPPRFSDSESTN